MGLVETDSGLLRQKGKRQKSRDLSFLLGTFQTATTDRGKEFSCHERIRDMLGLPMYFADPYSSWQRRSNENANGLLRGFSRRGQISERSVVLKSLKRLPGLMGDHENVSTGKLHTRSSREKFCT